MLHRSGVINKNQRGFMLIEVIVATAITSLMSVGITMAISHVLNVNALSTNHVTALKQVENAAYWISRDAQMAQIVQTSGGSGFPLNLSWIEWDNTMHQVSYSLEANKLERSHSVNSSEPSRTVVAQYINADSGMTNCQFVDGAFTFRVTASVGGFRPVSETRILQVIPRTAQ